MLRSFLIKRILPAALLPVFYVILYSSAASAIVSPRGGGELPEGFRIEKGKDARAFLPARGWIGKAARARPVPTGAPMRAFQTENGASPGMTGTMRIPVIGGLYTNYVGQPLQSLSLLQVELFDGPWATGTMKEYFEEASSGRFSVTGEVFGWVELANNEDYYVAAPSGGTTVGYSRTDEFIEESVAAVDGDIDFGQYDNDGPDNIPNSGDDDGYVDVLVLVHPAMGAECNSLNYHMWSHSYQYSLWDGVPGGPLETDDPSANGGVILVDDYIMAPTVSCDAGLIEIGVFCHETGHSIGLPDLYDTYGSYGIGYWGLMGSGNWNTPESPAHPCGWSKEQLGWVDVIDIGWEAVQYDLQPVIQSGEVIRLNTPARRFRRTVPMLAPLGWSMVCGYSEDEAQFREWPGGAGYGNYWNESISRSFSYNGIGPVTLDYHIATDLELGYDFAFIILGSSGGAEAETIKVFTGRNPLYSESIDLSGYLADPVYDEGYTITFNMVTDFNYSDEDGYFDSTPERALLVDNIRVTGGGEDHFADFEQDSGGWRNTSPPSEYFIVENRTRTGFDAHLRGQGLVIWHAESSIAYSSVGNTGGASNMQTRGLVLEEADGNYDLLRLVNAGDTGDPYPGTSGNRDFNSSTVPWSRDNNNNPTPVSVTGITSGSGVFKAGMPSPTVASITPDAFNKVVQDTLYFDVRGTGILYGAGCSLTRQGQTVDADSVNWLGENRIIARFEVSGLFAGDWDVTVTSGDGQSGTLEGALSVLSTITSASVEAGIDYIKPSWSVGAIYDPEGSLIFRSEAGGPFLQQGDTLRSDTGNFEYRDEGVLPETAYRYSVRVFYDDMSHEDLVFSGVYSTIDHDFEVIAEDVETGLDFLRPVWLVSPVSGLLGSIIYRSDDGGVFVQVGDTVRSETGSFEYLDDSVVPGVDYRYRARLVYYYTEDEFTFSGIHSVDDYSFHVIGQNPNPFSESTKITFFTPETMTVRIRFYDVSGRLVDDLGSVQYGRGTQEAVWDPQPGEAASGVYFCAVTAGGDTVTMKVVLIR
jgi:M6 family metalloprotease-like protein